MYRLIKYIIAFNFIILPLCTIAQNPSWQWAKNGGNTGSNVGTNQIIDLDIDKHGNIYAIMHNSPVLGSDSIYIDGQLMVDSTTRSFLVSWDCDGNYRWHKSHDTAFGYLATDSLEGVYVFNNQQGFTIRKYNSMGLFQWQKPTGIVGSQVHNDNTIITPDGYIYWLAALSSGSYDNNAFTVTNPGHYVICYNSTGVYQNHFRLPISYSYQPHPVGFFQRNHQNGNIYIGSLYRKDQGTLSIGSTAINSVDSMTYPMFLAAFDSNANTLWVKQTSAHKTTGLQKLIVNDDDILFVLGNAGDSTEFNNQPLISTPTGFFSRGFVLALDSNGNTLWNSHGTAGRFVINDMVLKNNTLGISGYHSGTGQWDGYHYSTQAVQDLGLFGKINALTGTVEIMDSLYTTLLAEATNIIADRNGQFYTGGTYIGNNTLGIPGLPLLNPVSTNSTWFIAQYGTNNCNCNIPKPDFVMSNPGGGNSYNFFYSGSLPNTSISWDFGDGSPTVSTLNAAHTYTANGTYPVCVTTTNACGTNTRCRYVYITNATSISSVDGFEDLKVYPNPAKESITIESSENLNDVKIYNSLGMMVKQQSLSGNKHHIAIHDWIPGVYFLRFTNREGKQESWSFVKE